MLIKNLTLTNFGIFYGKNSFDFRVNNDKNIILIGGKNGSGKTTILNGIRACLYGAQIFGSKNINNQYSEYIRESLNHKALEEGERICSIELEIDLEKDNIVYDYYIKREWTFEKNDKIIEKLKIKKNNEILEQIEIEEMENYFRTYMPKEIFDFFFFDGEKIKELMGNSELNNELKKEILVLFNLDIFESLSEDLNKFLKIKSDRKELSDDEQKIQILKDQLHHEKIFFEKIEKKLPNDIKKIEEISKKIEDLKEEYCKKGGLSKSDIEVIKVKNEFLNNSYQEILRDISDFTGELLPFIILQKMVIELKEEIKVGENKKAYDLLLSHLNISSLKEEFGEKNNIELEEMIDRLENLYKKKLLLNNKIKNYHSPSDDEIEILNNIFQKVENFKNNYIDEKYKKINEFKEEMKALRTKLEINEKDESLKNIGDEIKKMEENKNMLSLKYKDDKEIAAKRSLSIQELEIKIEIATNELKYSKEKITNKTLITNKVDKILKKYIHIKKTEKMKKIKYYFREMFNILHRKQDFINSIEIEENSLNIKLFDVSGNNISRNKLSEGEKQIYILSLLYALILTSERQIPLVMDTLLGRLDSEHRANILENYLKKVGKQIIILSTDSEIDNKYYKMIEERVAKKYEMNFDLKNNRVHISNSYFFD